MLLSERIQAARLSAPSLGSVSSDGDPLSVAAAWHLTVRLQKALDEQKPWKDFFCGMERLKWSRKDRCTCEQSLRPKGQVFPPSDVCIRFGVLNPSISF